MSYNNTFQLARSPQFIFDNLLKEEGSMQISDISKKVNYQIAFGFAVSIFDLKKQDDSIFSNLVFAHCRRSLLSHACFASTPRHDLVGLCVPVHRSPRMVPAFWRWLNGVSCQLCRRGVLDCRYFGSDSVAALAHVENRYETGQGILSFSDLPANSCRGDHAADNTNITGIKEIRTRDCTEQK